MWHKTKTAALLAGMKLAGRSADPEELLRRARDLGIALPIQSEMVSAPSVGGTSYAHRIEYHRLGELTAAIDAVIALGGKRAA